jgi:XTP/dITP diphosphohydrolase
MKRIFVCTGNQGKLAEFRAAFATLGDFEVRGIPDIRHTTGLEFEEPAEEADSFLANGFTKLLHAAEWLGRAAAKVEMRAGDLANHILVDDSGLCVPDLSFLPGVHSATFGGLPRDDAKNRTALRTALAERGTDEADAFFVCYLLGMDVDGAVFHSEGKVRVLEDLERCVHLPRAAAACAGKMPFGGEFTRQEGTDVAFGFCAGKVSVHEQNLIPGAGHGYDAMFYPVAAPRLSFASVTMEEKNRVSHRAAALRAFLGTQEGTGQGVHRRFGQET